MLILNICNICLNNISKVAYCLIRKKSKFDFFSNCIDFNSKLNAILRNKKNNCMIKTNCVVTMISCLLVSSVLVCGQSCQCSRISWDSCSCVRFHWFRCPCTLVGCAGMGTFLPAQCAEIKPLLVHVGSNLSYLFSIGYGHAADLMFACLFACFLLSKGDWIWLP